MKTSTERPRGAGGGSGRRRAFHMVMPYSTDSPRLYVSASTSGTAIHQASQATVEVQRQATYEPPNATTSRARQRTANNLVLLIPFAPPRWRRNLVRRPLCACVQIFFRVAVSGDRTNNLVRAFI